ncbi:hypothetical protein LC55x_4499 [Lysobacter capsici]|nr:hypothetical protein LC55x_4499 [Lysobacter capsici]
MRRRLARRLAQKVIPLARWRAALAAPVCLHLRGCGRRVSMCVAQRAGA